MFSNIFQTKEPHLRIRSTNKSMRKDRWSQKTHLRKTGWKTFSHTNTWHCTQKHSYYSHDWSIKCIDYLVINDKLCIYWLFEYTLQVCIFIYHVLINTLCARKCLWLSLQICRNRYQGDTTEMYMNSNLQLVS